MPQHDISALLDSLQQVGKPPSNGTKDDGADRDQAERIELRQKAAGVGLTVHALIDAEMLRSLIVRKEFLNQHARDTMKPNEVEKQQEQFESLQNYGSGILEATLEYLKPRGSVEQAKETARSTFEDHAAKSGFKKGSDESALAFSVFDASLDAITERLHDKSDGAE